MVGIEFDKVSLDETVDQIIGMVRRGVPSFVITPNVDHTNHHRINSEYRQVVKKAALVVADGMPIVWAARLFGTPLKGRVNGTDLFEALAEACAREGLSIYLMGALPGVAEECAKNLKLKSPSLRIAGTYSPAFGYLDNAEESEKMVRLVKEAKPDILFLGVTPPKGETWICRHFEEMGVPVSIQVGGSFDFVAGNVKRAPRFMQKTGLEWLFRFISEPRRLWRRYVIGNPVFIFRVVAQFFRLKFRPGR